MLDSHGLVEGGEEEAWHPQHVEAPSLDL